MNISGKALKLSKSFWYKFVPNTNKMFGPQNIKFEIWDMGLHKVEEKWHPELFCIRDCAFNKSAQQFLLSGGCLYNESDLYIYDTQTLEVTKKIQIPEKSANPIFNLDDCSIFLGTHDGNFYKFDINSEILYDEKKEGDRSYFTIRDKSSLLFHLSHSMIYLSDSDPANNNVFLAIIPVITKDIENDKQKKDNYILMYNIDHKTQKEIRIPSEDPVNIVGMKYRNGKLAILTNRYGGKENEALFYYANFYIYDLENNTLMNVYENFKLCGEFSNTSALSWATDTIVAVISLESVLIFDIENNIPKHTLSFDKPSSVEFSADGFKLAVGGNKAKLYNFSFC